MTKAWVRLYSMRLTKTNIMHQHHKRAHHTLAGPGEIMVESQDAGVRVHVGLENINPFEAMLLSSQALAQFDYEKFREARNAFGDVSGDAARVEETKRRLEGRVAEDEKRAAARAAETGGSDSKGDEEEKKASDEAPAAKPAEDEPPADAAADE